MNAKLSVVAATCAALLLPACGSSPQSLIFGKWEVSSAEVAGVAVAPAEAGKTIKMTAEFDRDGTAKITMFGQTLQGKYRLDTDNELEWTLNGITTKGKVNVTATELDVTDGDNRTIKYTRK